MSASREVPLNVTRTESLNVEEKVVTDGWIKEVAAEFVATFFLIFVGCGVIVVNELTHGQVTFPGICILWGALVMALISGTGHISGAHFNPAVTIAFATYHGFPWKRVPAYVSAQCCGATCASLTLRFLLGDVALLGATLPAGSALQAFVLEVLITAMLLFVVSAVATDTRAVGSLASVSAGSAVMVLALFAGPISGASMNPARSIGPAIASLHFEYLWIYIFAPTMGALLGAGIYSFLRVRTEVETPLLGL